MSEFVLANGSVPIDEHFRPGRQDYLRIFSELSKMVQSIPLLEGGEVTVADCTIREHSEYLKLIRKETWRSCPLRPCARLNVP